MRNSDDDRSPGHRFRETFNEYFGTDFPNARQDEYLDTISDFLDAKIECREKYHHGGVVNSSHLPRIVRGMEPHQRRIREDDDRSSVAAAGMLVVAILGLLTGAVLTTIILYLWA